MTTSFSNCVTASVNSLCLLVAVSLSGIGCAGYGALDGQEVPSLKKRIADLQFVVDRLRIGMSEQDVDGIIRTKFRIVTETNYSSQHPFVRLLPQSASHITEWRTVDAGENGWPDIVFTYFEDDTKTSLIDVLWIHSGQVTIPVDGSYNQNLRRVKVGDSIDKVFSALGMRDAEYFYSDGKWRIKLRYWGYHGRLIIIEADAANAQITSVYDGTI